MEQPAIMDVGAISTHSLTRRLTLMHHLNWIQSFYFNSQPHKEADSLPGYNHIGTPYFNSQPHKEADVTKSKFYPVIAYFNSQPHKEADWTWLQNTIEKIISTHSLTRRLTLFLTSIIIHQTYFNSQPHKEADVTVFVNDLPTESFQLTASQGGWPLYVNNYFIFFLFQLTASQGGWPIWKMPSVWPFLFQLTASQGGWLSF